MRRALPLALALIGCYPNPQDLRQLEQPALDGAAPAADGDLGEPVEFPLDGAAPDAADDVGALDANADGPADAPADGPTDAAVLLDRGAADLAGAGDVSVDLADAPPPFERHCADYAQNFCARYLSCAPYDLQRIFGNEATCRDRVTLSCNLAELPGTAWPSKACADAYQSLSCDNFNNNLQPAACLAPGALADGASCADETQCQGRRCIVVQGTACGKCGSKRLMNEPCLSDESCVQGLVCPPSKTCTAPGGSGTPCDANHPCQAQLACRGGTCAARGAAGDACQAGRDCDSFNGVGCNGSQGMCRAFTSADDCQTAADGSFHVCFQSGFCQAGTYQCLFVAHDGDPCSADQGPNCLLPAQCVGGKCTVPNLRTACP
jgi:hypothetical protein